MLFGFICRQPPNCQFTANVKTLSLLPSGSLAIVEVALAARKFERRRNIFCRGDLQIFACAELNCNDVVVDRSRNNIAESSVVEVNRILLRGVEYLIVAVVSAEEEIIRVVGAVESVHFVPKLAVCDV